jgi:regulator of sigma E protease
MQLIHWLAQNGIGLIAVVMSFGFLIFIHELGHFIMAKRAGVRVYEFALGLFGPQIIMAKRDKDKKMRFYFLPFLKKKEEAPAEAAVESGAPAGAEASSGDASPPDTAAVTVSDDRSDSDETEYSIRLIPMGGFVDMREDSAPADDHDRHHFQNATIWNKIKIVACGPLMNYVTALLLFWFIGLAWGVGSFYLKPRIGEVIKGSPAESIGLQHGDYITAIDGVKVKDAFEMMDIIHKSPEQEITLQIQRGTGRDEQVFEKSVRTVLVPDIKERVGMIGFKVDQKALDIKFTPAPPGTVLKEGLDQMKHFTIAPFYAFALIFKGKMKAKEIREGSAGPVGIGQMFFETYNKGFKCLLYLCAVVNVLIGAFNLLPIPPLDGFRIFQFGVEWVRRKPFNQTHVGYVLTAGFVLLMSMVVFFTYYDIVRLIKGVSFFK